MNKEEQVTVGKLRRDVNVKLEMLHSLLEDSMRVILRSNEKIEQKRLLNKEKEVEILENISKELLAARLWRKDWEKNVSKYARTHSVILAILATCFLIHILIQIIGR